jgi:hypothetical protein
MDLEAAPGSQYSFSFYAYDRDGGTVLRTFDGRMPDSGFLRFEIDYDPSPGSPQNVTETSTQPPAPAPAPPSPPTRPPAPPMPVAPTATQPPRPTAAPTASPPPTATSTPIPVVIESFAIESLIESQYMYRPGVCSTTLAWSVSGPPQTTVRLLRNGEVVQDGPQRGSYSRNFEPGTWTYQLRVTSPSQTIMSNPILITPICIRSFTASHTCSGTGVRLDWDIDGTATGPLTILNPIVYSGTLPANNDSPPGGQLVSQAQPFYYLRASVGGRNVEFGFVDTAQVIC